MTGFPYRRRAPGALVILMLLFATSGAVRLGSGIGAAMAASEGSAETPAPPLTCPEPPAALVAALQSREEALAAREVALTDRIAALRLVEETANARIAALEEAEAKLAATVAITDGAAEADLARLTSVYEAMKPKDAGALFAAMDPPFAAGFLGRMRPEAAAAVMSGMPPEAAYAVSVLLAGRNALAPTE